MPPAAILSSKLLQMGSGKMSAEHLHTCAHQLILSMLSHLLEHLRRGKIHALWDHLLAGAERDTSAFEADPSPGMTSKIAEV